MKRNVLYFLPIILIFLLSYGCGNKIEDITSGKYLPGPPALSVIEISAKNSTTVEVIFDEAIISYSVDNLNNYC